VKNSEEEILKFSRAVEQSPVSVMITDTKGDIEYVNPKFERLTGYTLDEVKGQNPRFLNAGGSPKVCYKELWNLISDGKEWSGEFHNRKKMGNYFGNLLPYLRFLMELERSPTI
jgi:PAS domain S-box-containing protein